MNRRIWKLLFLVWLMVFCGFVFVDYARAFKTKAGTMYYGSDPVATIAWNAASGAVGYQVQLVMFDKSPITIIAQADTSETNITLSRSRSGQFIVKVRSWNWKDEGEKQYSVWATSDDPKYAEVDGVPEGWWIYWQLPAVGGGGIE